MEHRWRMEEVMGNDPAWGDLALWPAVYMGEIWLFDRQFTWGIQYFDRQYLGWFHILSQHWWVIFKGHYICPVPFRWIVLRYPVPGKYWQYSNRKIHFYGLEQCTPVLRLQWFSSMFIRFQCPPVPCKLHRKTFPSCPVPSRTTITVVKFQYVHSIRISRSKICEFDSGRSGHFYDWSFKYVYLIRIVPDTITVAKFASMIHSIRVSRLKNHIMERFFRKHGRWGQRVFFM